LTARISQDSSLSLLEGGEPEELSTKKTLGQVLLYLRHLKEEQDYKECKEKE